MNKNLFKIESDEVLRILSLHEERTKNQYLNIINEGTGNVSDPDYGKSSGGGVLIEQSTTPPQSWTVSSQTYILATDKGGNNNDLKIFKGAKFDKKTNKQGQSYLSTQIVPINLTDGGRTQGEANASVFYWCKTKKFSISTPTNITIQSAQFQEKDDRWKDDSGTLSNQLDKVCTYNASGTDKSVKGKQGNTYTQGESHKFTVFKTKMDVTIKVGTVWVWKPDVKRLVTKTPYFEDPKDGDYYGVFYCGAKGGFHGYNYKTKVDRFLVDQDKKLTGIFNKLFCSTVGSGEAPKQELPKKDSSDETLRVSTPGQFTQNVVNLNTEIQTSLGVQTPTGQLTDADIDAILAKLG